MAATCLEPLLGVTFDGHLAPPDGPKCRVKYAFGRATPDAIPTAVRKQRREVGWKCGAGVASISATCSIPALGLRNEEVVVSVDPPGRDGERRMLLQSLARPELGVTVLVLSADGQTLAGGDETWSPGDPPVIQTSCARSKEQKPESPKAEADAAKASADTATPASPSKPAAVEAKATDLAANSAKGYPAEPKGTRARAAFVTSVPGADDADDDGRVAAVGVWRARPDDEASKYAAVAGGIGRHVMGASADARHEPSRAQAEELRPDVAISAGDTGPSGVPSDAEILAAQAEAAERLVAAAGHGELGDMKLLQVRVGVDVAAAGGRQKGLTPLMAASQRGRDEAVSLLIEQKASLDAADPQGWTAVMHATSSQRIGSLRLLLQAGASAHVLGADDGTTPLMLAAAGPRVEYVNELLANGATAPSARESKDNEGHTALHIAAKNGRGAAMCSLIEARARLEARDTNGCTPLLVAAEAGRAESLRILLARRADVEAKDDTGRSAVDLARTWGHDRALDVLLDSGS
mmetsp:Transcript_139149/g.242137  ORF Transcript_139149/g.242137 Transcript_139149/m.242137 type:complete len:523 (+) Transcript_139149:70-1638(+)